MDQLLGDRAQECARGGRAVLAELLERNCRQARRFAEGLREAGFSVLNDVVLNQVVVSFGDDETTLRDRR